MAYSDLNPIRSVDGKAIVKSPSSYLWKLEDVSAADAGRTEDTVMHKKRVGQLCYFFDCEGSECASPRRKGIAGQHEFRKRFCAQVQC